eukprot:g1760.t1
MDDDACEHSPAARSLSTCRNWCSFWTLGAINNFAYVVILCAAANLADSFNDGKLTGFVQWANVAVGVGVRALNMYCLSTSTFKRFYIVTIAFLLGYVALSVSVYFDFWVAISSIIFIGGACSFGESLILGYMKNYPSMVTGGWSSGTGMAGVGGSAFYLAMWLLLHGHLNYRCTDSLFIIFACLIPLTFVYLVVFVWGPTRPEGLRGGCVCDDHDSSVDLSFTSKMHLQRNGQANSASDVHGNALNASPDLPLLENAEDYGSGAEAGIIEASEQIRMHGDKCSCSRLCRIVGLVKVVGINLMLVYFFEYVISVAFAIHAPSLMRNGQWWCTNGYTVLQFSYQSGVLLSRSSLQYLRISNVSVLTALQGVNFVF